MTSEEKNSQRAAVVCFRRDLFARKIEGISREIERERDEKWDTQALLWDCSFPWAPCSSFGKRALQLHSMF